VTEQLVQKASEAKPERRSAPQAADPNIKAAETKLRRAFGTQVKILQAADGRGKVEISFFNTQDLDRIYNLLMPHVTEM
jgi:ParB family chromosome partitioning protein